MLCPQWLHDFEPIALGFRLTTHQTMDAIKAPPPDDDAAEDGDEDK